MLSDKLKRGTKPAASGGGGGASSGFTTSWLASTYDHPYPASGAYILECPASDASFKLQTLSVEVWYKIGTVNGAATILDLYTPNQSGYAFKVLLNDYATNYHELDCSVRFGGTTVTNSLLAFKSGTVPGDWVHFVATYATGSLILYINGVSSKSGSYPGPIVYSSTYGAYINCDQNGAGGLTPGTLAGTVGLLKVYNTILSATDVSAHYAAGHP